MSSDSTAALPRPIYFGERVAALPDDPHATLSVRPLVGILTVGAAAGLPLPELLSLAQVSPEQLGDPDGAVPAAAVARVLRRIEEALPDEPLSLRVLAMSPPSVFGLVELASASAETVGEGMDLYLRYARLTSSHVQCWLDRAGDLSVFRIRHLASLEALRHPVEVGVGHAHRILARAGVPQEDVLEVHFAHAPLGPAARYVEHFGCPVHFESFGHGVVMRAEALARPIRHADPVLSRSVVTRLERAIGDEDDLLSVLRREIAAHAQPAQYNATKVARHMGRSLRSLQRDAARAGTTLRRVLDDVRITRARELLLDASLSVDEVGFLVDYSERAAFSRAFKRATGETPAEYRRRGAN